MKISKWLLSAFVPMLLLTGGAGSAFAQSEVAPEKSLLNRVLRLVALTGDDEEAIEKNFVVETEFIVEEDGKGEKKSRRAKKKKSEKDNDAKAQEHKDITVRLNVQRDGKNQNGLYLMDADGKLQVIDFGADGGPQMKAHSVVMASKYMLGVYCTPASDVLKKHLQLDDALVIEKVMPETAASDAGLEEHDLILSVNGDKVASGEDLIKIVADNGAEELTLKLIRAGEKMTVKATPRERKPGDLTMELEALSKGENTVHWKSGDGNHMELLIDEFLPGIHLESSDDVGKVLKSFKGLSLPQGARGAIAVGRADVGGDRIEKLEKQIKELSKLVKDLAKTVEKQKRE